VRQLDTATHLDGLGCLSWRQDAEYLDAKHAILPAVFRAIVQSWESDLKHYAFAEVEIGATKYRSYSSFLNMMRTTRWLRSVDGVWCRPDELFSDTREVRDLLCIMHCDLKQCLAALVSRSARFAWHKVGRELGCFGSLAPQRAGTLTRL
jgi:hypothetical protein